MKFKVKRAKIHLNQSSKTGIFYNHQKNKEFKDIYQIHYLWRYLTGEIKVSIKMLKLDIQQYHHYSNNLNELCPILKS